MKVGTDAVLLGAWTEVKDSGFILDVGTGCGIIALILAQKNTSASIRAIDVDRESIEEARINFTQSLWKNNLKAICSSFEIYSAENQNKFDLIVSNPPYFQNGIASPHPQRQRARHAITLSPSVFFGSAVKCLSITGEISLILPAYKSELWFDAAKSNGLFPVRVTMVFSYPGKPAERILATFGKHEVIPQKDVFTIRDEKGGCYTDEYLKLTKEYLL